jgi:high-affinity nickel-transport protein
VDGHHHGAPFGALLALPLLYTAGMVLMDTTDGVVMTQAYGWAFMSPFRKMYYNMATVGLGIFIAGAVGLMELLKVVAANAQWKAQFWVDVNHLNFETLGYGIVAVFVVLWLAAVLSYRLFRFEERYALGDLRDAEAYSQTSST